jgi:hypothetical protein
MFLDSENSDRAKDTWCSPHCLNAVHEGAGDGCVHGKLKEDKLRRQCRGTSLQASNRELEHLHELSHGRHWSWVLLSVFFELLLEVVNEDNETACSVSGEATTEMG